MRKQNSAPSPVSCSGDSLSCSPVWWKLNFFRSSVTQGPLGQSLFVSFFTCFTVKGELLMRALADGLSTREHTERGRMWQGFCGINSRRGWLGTHDALHPLAVHSSLRECVVRVPLAPLPPSFLECSWGYQTIIRSWGACLLVKKEGRRQGSDPLRSSVFSFRFLLQHSPDKLHN